MIGYDYSIVLSNWEQRVKEYSLSLDKARRSYIANPSPARTKMLKHRVALKRALEHTVKVLRRSLYDALQHEADPVMFFNDNLVPEKPTLDRIIGHGTPATKGHFTGDCRKIVEDLDKVYRGKYIAA